MIKAILFDVDNTLLDFDETARRSMAALFAAHGFLFEAGSFAVFSEINHALWSRLERGELSDRELHRIRWNLIFERLGIVADGERCEAEFRALLSEQAPLVDGALELLRACKGKYLLCAASNASVAQQDKRLAKSGILPLLDRRYYSEAIGAAKPSPAFFRACLCDLNLKKEEVLMVGDSLSADIEGGLAFGLPVCWYHPGESPALPGVRRITRLIELISVLEGIPQAPV